MFMMLYIRLQIHNKKNHQDKKTDNEMTASLYYLPVKKLVLVRYR